MTKRALSIVTLALLISTCGRPAYIGYIVVPLKHAPVAPEMDKPMRVVIMDPVEDQHALDNPKGGNAEVAQFRKSLADGLLRSYRRTFPKAQITSVPLDAGHELLVWRATPSDSLGYVFMSWRAEYLLDGRLLGEVSSDELGKTKLDNVEEALSTAISECVEQTYALHMNSVGAFKKAAAPGKRRFLNRGHVFKVDGENLTISSRLDFPGRMGQVFEIVDERQRPIGRLKVKSTYHTNFHATLLSGRAAAGAEVGVFVKQN